MARKIARPKKGPPKQRSTAKKPPAKAELVIDTGESLPERRKRCKKALLALRRHYGEVTCALTHETALQLLIATILSAQSTDENVNRVTPALWAKYKSAGDFAASPEGELEEEVHSTGFFRQKAKNIRAACRLIDEEFGGQVPDNMEDLLTLPGVARKTANVVLGTWFGQNVGVVVDTHVGRLSQRLGFTWRSRDSKDAVKIERDLMELVPHAAWTYFSHVLIHHGRAVCSARKPDCNQCRLAKLCPSADVAGA